MSIKKLAGGIVPWLTSVLAGVVTLIAFPPEYIAIKTGRTLIPGTDIQERKVILVGLFRWVQRLKVAQVTVTSVSMFRGYTRYRPCTSLRLAIWSYRLRGYVVNPGISDIITRKLCVNISGLYDSEPDADHYELPSLN